jgi:hypothetical protein
MIPDGNRTEAVPHAIFIFTPRLIFDYFDAAFAAASLSAATLIAAACRCCHCRHRPPLMPLMLPSAASLFFDAFSLPLIDFSRLSFDAMLLRHYFSMLICFCPPFFRQALSDAATPLIALFLPPRYFHFRHFR